MPAAGAAAAAVVGGMGTGAGAAAAAVASTSGLLVLSAPSSVCWADDGHKNTI